MNTEKKNKISVKKWPTPFGVVLDGSQPGKFVVKGHMTLSNLQYLIQLIKLELKKNTKTIVLDLSKVKQIEKESISLLLNLYTRLKLKGISVEIKGPQRFILNLFKQYDVDEV